MSRNGVEAFDLVRLEIGSLPPESTRLLWESMTSVGGRASPVRHLCMSHRHRHQPRRKEMHKCKRLEPLT